MGLERCEVDVATAADRRACCRFELHLLLAVRPGPKVVIMEAAEVLVLAVARLGFWGLPGQPVLRRRTGMLLRLVEARVPGQEALAAARVPGQEALAVAELPGQGELALALVHSLVLVHFAHSLI